MKFSKYKKKKLELLGSDKKIAPWTELLMQKLIDFGF